MRFDEIKKSSLGWLADRAKFQGQEEKIRFFEEKLAESDQVRVCTYYI